MHFVKKYWRRGEKGDSAFVIIICLTTLIFGKVLTIEVSKNILNNPAKNHFNNLLKAGKLVRFKLYGQLPHDKQTLIGSWAA